MRQWLLATKADVNGTVRKAKFVHLWNEDGPALCGYKRWNVRPNRTPAYIESDCDKCPKCSAALYDQHFKPYVTAVAPTNPVYRP